MIIDDLFSKKQGIAEGGIATVGWPDEGNSTRNNTPVSVGGTFDARPVVKRGSLVKASGLTGVYRVMDILRDEAKIVQEIPRTGQSTYVPMSDLRVWTNKPIREQGMAEGQLELNTPDPVVVVQDQQGKILDKINLSVAAQKYKLGQPQNIKNQLAHQNYTKIGNYTIVSPMTGQPQDATTQGVAEGSLEEVDRRGFLKGLGAAAVAGAAGSAKGQDAAYFATYAAKLAAETVKKGIPGIGPLKFDTDDSKGGWYNYVYPAIHKLVLAYCLDTNSYNAKNVIDSVNAEAARESGVESFGRSLTSKVNTFVSTYQGLILTKYEQYRRSGAGNQQPQQQQPQQQQTQQTQQQTNIVKLSPEENSILNKALYVYYFTKNSPDEQGNFQWVSKEIGNFIKLRDAKGIVNDSFRKISDFLEKTKEADPKKYAGFAQWVKLNGQQAIDDLKNLTQPKPQQNTDEFNESVNQGVAEGMAGKVVFSGTGANGSTYEIIQSSPTDFMIHANGRHIDTYGSLQRAMSVLKNEVPGLQQGMAEASLGDYRKKAAVSQAGAKINKFFDRNDPAKVAAADQTIAKRERGLARADARIKPYTPPTAAPADLEKQQRDLTAKYPDIDELVRRAELNRDPDYEMADGQAYYAARDAEQNYQKLKQIQRVIQGLNESLDRSHLP